MAIGFAGIWIFSCSTAAPTRNVNVQPSRRSKCVRKPAWVRPVPRGTDRDSVGGDPSWMAPPTAVPPAPWTRSSGRRATVRPCGPPICSRATASIASNSQHPGLFRLSIFLKRSLHRKTIAHLGNPAWCATSTLWQTPTRSVPTQLVFGTPALQDTESDVDGSRWLIETHQSLLPQRCTSTPPKPREHQNSMAAGGWNWSETSPPQDSVLPDQSVAGHQSKKPRIPKDASFLLSDQDNGSLSHQH